MHGSEDECVRSWQKPRTAKNRQGIILQERGLGAISKHCTSTNNAEFPILLVEKTLWHIRIPGSRRLYPEEKYSWIFQDSAMFVPT